MLAASLNGALGRAGLMLALAAAAFGALATIYGVRRHERAHPAHGAGLRLAVPGRSRLRRADDAAGAHHPRLLTGLRPAGRLAHDSGALQRRRDVVGARGLDPAVGRHLGRLHGGRRLALPTPDRGPARRLGDGGDVHRDGVLRAPQLRAGRPVRRRPGRTARVRRPRSQPAAAEPRARPVPPADPLPRLRRDHRAVRVRHRRPRHRTSRRGLAARDPPLGAVRMGVPDDRHPARRLVELRGARVERGVGLGSRRERQLPAVAHGALPTCTPCWCRSAGGCCGSGTSACWWQRSP